MGVILLNAVNVYSSHGVALVDPGDFWGGVQEDIAAVMPHGVHLSMRGSGFEAPPKVWPARLRGRWATKAIRETSLDAFRRTLAITPSGVSSYRLAQEREVSIQVDPSSRVVYGVYRGDQVTDLPGANWETGWADIVVPFLLLDQAKYDASAMSQALAAGSGLEEEIALGTLPSWWDLEIDGPATDPDMIVYEDDSGAPGDEIWRMSFTMSLGSGQSRVIDGLRQIAYDPSDPDTDLTDSILPVGGDSTAFRQLEPAAGTDSVWVEITDGTGTLGWRRRWR